MDDHNFDEFVKGRLDGYEDPSFDPAALEGFHAKLASFRPTPWYEQHLSQYLMAASLTLFTVVNLYLFWPEKEVATESRISQTNTSQTTIDSLTVVIEELKTQSQVSVRLRDSLVNHFNTISAANTNVLPATRLQNNGLYLGLTSEIPSDLYHSLLVKKMLLTDNGQAYLIAPDKSNESFAGLSELDLTGIGETYPWPVASLTNLELKSRTEQPDVIIPQKARVISSKMRKALEKHYSKGIGIYVAPHADLAKNVFSTGSGGITPKLGVTADWVLSPSLSVETGLDYSTTSVSLDRGFQNVLLPTPDQSLGALDNVQIKNFLVSAPVALKYRQWISEKSQAFVKAGYTPYATFRQEYTSVYDFDRPFDPNPGFGPGPNPMHHHVTSVDMRNDKEYYGATGSVSAGITKLMTSKNKLEASLFYEKSLGSVGSQGMGLQLFGLRAAYWFNLR